MADVIGPDDQFAVSPDYVNRALNKRMAVISEQLTLQEGAFDQLRDMYNQRISELESTQEELAKVRGEIEQHEELAVSQQMIVDEFNLFKKMLSETGTEYDDIHALLHQVHTSRVIELDLEEGEDTRG